MQEQEVYTLPSEGFVRLKHVLKVIPLSRTGFLRKVRKGEFPPPIKVGSHTAMWRVEDIRKLIAQLSGGNS